MWRERGIPALVMILAAGMLAGCATALPSGATCPACGVQQGFDPKTTGSISGPKQQGSSNGLTPSFAAHQAPSREGTSAKEEPRQISDPRAAEAAAALSAVSTPGSYAYKIGPQDLLDISVYQVPELSKTVEVSYMGTINFPPLGETKASGRTTEELQRDLASRLGAKYLQNPQVTVLVKQYNSSRVTITGAVGSPGVYPYKGESLLQTVAQAGGLAKESNSTILVLRETNGKRAAARFDYEDIKYGRAPDPAIKAGDVVIADASVVKKGLNSYWLGQIMRWLPMAGALVLL
jgi:polysaccharide export outer membrane protein